MESTTIIPTRSRRNGRLTLSRPLSALFCLVFVLTSVPIQPVLSYEMLPGAEYYSFMYNGGTVNITLSKLDVPETTVSFVVSPVEDRDLWNNGAIRICNDNAIKSGECTVNQTNQIIFNKNHPPKSESYTTALNKDKRSFAFTVKSNGLYIIYGQDTTSAWSADIQETHTYGLLPATDYPKLGFYLALFIIYLIVFGAWMIKSAMYWRDLLPIQHVLSGVLFVVMFEMAIHYAYYNDYNANGVGLTGLYLFVILLNATRNSFSMFMLLIVSLGYGVIKPSLGETMKRCIGLGILLFIFNAFYSMGAMTRTPPSKLMVLLVSLPLSIIMTIFYSWIMNALQYNIAKLAAKRQIVKLEMYQTLWKALSVAIFIFFVYMVVNVVFVFKLHDLTFMSNHLQSRWFLTDGWLNLVYMAVFGVILWLWRPTSNNARYGLEQLGDGADEEEGYGMGSFTAGLKRVNNNGDGNGARGAKSNKGGNMMGQDSDDEDDNDEFDIEMDLDDAFSPSSGPSNKKSPAAHTADESSPETADDIMKWVEDHVGDERDLGSYQSLDDFRNPPNGKLK